MGTKRGGKGPPKDAPGAVAFNAAAPAAERLAASTELTKATVQGGLGDLIPPEPIMRVIRHIQQDLQEQDLAKSAKAIKFTGAYNHDRNRRGPHSVVLDELQVNALGD